MTLLELHYTSVERGLGGSPGFQFVQLPSDLDPGICRQVESLLAYEPPRTAPSQPTSAEIADFPVALSYTLLADEVALWVATACRSLPRAIAQQLTFTTYTRRPYQSSQQIIGIMPGADFSFTYTELTSQYRVHARFGQSSPPVEPTTWAATAAA